MIPFNEHEFALREDFVTSVAYLFKLHEKSMDFIINKSFQRQIIVLKAWKQRGKCNVEACQQVEAVKVHKLRSLCIGDDTNETVLVALSAVI